MTERDKKDKRHLDFCVKYPETVQYSGDSSLYVLRINDSHEPLVIDYFKVISLIKLYDENSSNNAFSKFKKIRDDWNELLKITNAYHKNNDVAFEENGLESCSECDEKDEIYIFKVQDYITELVGRFNRKGDFFYIQRGDGFVRKYDADRVVYKEKVGTGNE